MAICNISVRIIHNNSDGYEIEGSCKLPKPKGLGFLRDFFMNFKVTFQLDGTGVYYDAYEPPHLDDILHSILILLNRQTRHLQRDEDPDETGLPFMQDTRHGVKLWKASALMPEGVTFETLRFFRKKFDQEHLDLTDATVNLQNGVYREYNIPVPVLCASKLIAYAQGNCKEVKRLLKKHLPAIGKYRGQGFGRVVNVECEHIEDDWSWVKDGKAMRWLPDPNGLRFVRPRPPYWNITGRVTCCEVGDPV